MTLSMLGSCAVCERTHGPELMRISPVGERTVLATGQVGEAISGNARGSDGTVYYALWAPGNAAGNGVYKLLADGTPKRIAAQAPDSVPNGLAVDRTDARSTSRTASRASSGPFPSRADR
ncbi:hypothetical protein ACFU6S_39175 [Streptomyces sp. NPDC057456]|uniref:hypothetical protein n=1 Tax=Streptomyces sp. NPDC057456 TaxID=3346139 RepID=UPI00368F9E4D